MDKSSKSSSDYKHDTTNMRLVTTPGTTTTTTILSKYRIINPVVRSIKSSFKIGIRFLTNNNNNNSINSNKWVSSRIMTINKSKFQSHIIKFNKNDNLNDLISDLISNNKSIQKSSHPAMLAWRTGSEEEENEYNKSDSSNKRKTTKTSNSNSKSDSTTYVMKNLRNFNQGFHDDGEGGSGQRLTGLIERLKLVNILVVVTRWYGGIPLGSTRFRCISDITIENLKEIGILNLKLSNKNWYINYENFIKNN